MEELYWITRLDAICLFFRTVSIIAIIFAALLIIAAFIAMIDPPGENITKRLKTASKTVFPVLIFGIIGTIFTPTTKEMLLIYGVGGTIDYIKQNETIQQLPDKCVEALDLFIDDYIEEEKDKNEN